MGDKSSLMGSAIDISSRQSSPRLYSLFFRTLYLIMLVNGLYWLLMAVLGSGANVSHSVAVLSAALCALVLLFPNRAKAGYIFLMANKWMIVVVMVLLQLTMLLSSNLLLRSDSARIFNAALCRISEQAASYYVSTNINNLPLFLNERLFCNVFGNAAIWPLELVNILLVDIALLPLSLCAKRLFTQEVADVAFVLYVLTVGLTPEFLVVYTDPISLPLTATQLLAGLQILDESTPSHHARWGVVFGLVTGVGMFFRATLLIFVIAMILTLLLSFDLKRTAATLVCFSLGFLPIYMIGTHLIDTQGEVVVTPGVSRNVFTWFDLGLTFSGDDQVDFQDGLALFTHEKDPETGYDDRYSRDVVMKDIIRRLRAYTPSTFVEHLLYKQGGLYMDGTFGWCYTDDPTIQIDYYINPLFEGEGSNPLLDFVRTRFVSADTPQSNHYRCWLRLVYIIVVAGMIPLFLERRGRRTEDVLVLAVFGALLFLLLFEGHKARYLIQFMPQIILCSAIGLTRMKGTYRRVSPIT